MTAAENQKSDFAPESAHRNATIRYTKRKQQDNRFETWLAKMQKSEPGSVTNEFKQLQSVLKSQVNTVDIWRSNSEFNRYNDMVCFDQSRVVLNDGLHPDYIHANWVHGYCRKNAYVLTQGPLDGTACDFWRMIWQEKIGTIVMVTRLVERNKPKCGRYFPLSNESDFQSGIFKIAITKIEKRPPICNAVLLNVTNLLNKEVRCVVHIWYWNWPDQGIPGDTMSFRYFLNFVKVVNANMGTEFYNTPQIHVRGPPLLFHCSAGIGRSAVLVVLDIIAEAMLHNDFCEPYELVQEIRTQRYHAIHTKIQLLFVYDYVLTLAYKSRLLAQEPKVPGK